MSDHNATTADHDLDPAELFARRNTAPVQETPTFSPEGGLATVRVSVGPTILRGDGSPAFTQGPVSINTGHMIGDGSAGILSTGQNKQGSPRAPSELTPDDLVKVDGTNIEVRLAERLGYLKRLPDGTYQEVERPKEQVKAKEEAPQDTAEALPDKHLEGDLSEFVNGTDAGTQVQALVQLIEDGEMKRATLETAASQLNMHPREVAERLEAVMDGFRSQAAAYAKGCGIGDPEAFFDWARENHAREFNDAMRRHGMERTTAVYGPLAQAYVMGLADRDPEAILSAKFGNGGSARRGTDGRIVINVPGHGEMDWRNAVRLGFINAKAIQGL